MSLLGGALELRSQLVYFIGEVERVVYTCARLDQHHQPSGLYDGNVSSVIEQ